MRSHACETEEPVGSNGLSIGGVGYTPQMLREQIADLKSSLDDKQAPVRNTGCPVIRVDHLIPVVRSRFATAASRSGRKKDKL